jgi:hypothetical protein
MDTNIGEIITSTIYYYLKMLCVEKFMNLKIVQCDGFVLSELVHISSENIVQIAEIVNEHNGHSQPNIHSKINSNGCERKAMKNLHTKPSNYDITNRNF